MISRTQKLSRHDFQSTTLFTKKKLGEDSFSEDRNPDQRSSVRHLSHVCSCTKKGDVVAQLGMWWLSRGRGGSVGDVVAQLGMRWLRMGCGDTVVLGC
jgi:hypothetical protein